MEGFPKKQRGSTLLVSLVLLLLLTVLALSSARTASLQQRMSANLQQKTLAFQAAESGIAVAIFRLRKDTAQWPPNIGDKKGLCAGVNSFADWSSGVCTLSGEHGYQVVVERVSCNGGSNICFDIHSHGMYANYSVMHQQGYVFTQNELDSL